MSTPVPPSIVQPFAFAGGATVPIPFLSQVAVSPELASYTDGFPPATRTPRTSGGIPPRGLDMNGILYSLSAHVSWTAAGMVPLWNADVVANATGYPLGAVVRNATDNTKRWLNTTANNTTDPDAAGAGWTGFSVTGGGGSALDASIVTPGTKNNVAVAAGVGYLDINTTAGNVDVSGFLAAFDGQTIVVSNVGTGLLQILALSGSSTAGNQVRIPTDMGLVQNQSATFRKSAAIGKWVSL